MSTAPAPADPGPLTPWPVPLRWALLALLSVALGGLLEWLRLPAALLIGPMLAGIAVENLGGRLRLHRLGLVMAQATVGCLMARAIEGSIVDSLVSRWPLFILVVGGTLGVSVALGWMMGKRGVVPGTTAIWGLMPGAASAMTMMAESYGADGRIVAFMQYLRVVLVVLAAALLAGGLGAHAGHAQATDWFPPWSGTPLLVTFGVIALGVVFGRRSRVPSGTLLLPLAAGAALQSSGLVMLDLPPWLLAVSYLLLGWSIGLRFSRQVLRSARRALPAVLLAIAVMVVASGLISLLLVVLAGVDPLTAYLATSPGGADSVAIIAASSHVDRPFVMAFQTARLVVVMLLGPAMAQWLAKRALAQAAH